MGKFMENVLCWMVMIGGIFIVCVGIVDCLDWEAKRAQQGYGYCVAVMEVDCG